jgi:predicted HAD superfamily Cof-like phosphohydrolase
MTTLATEDTSHRPHVEDLQARIRQLEAELRAEKYGRPTATWLHVVAPEPVDHSHLRWSFGLDKPACVGAFMMMAGQRVPTKPTKPNGALARLRTCIIVEEAFELVKASMTPEAFTRPMADGLTLEQSLNIVENDLKTRGDDEWSVNLVEAADALADILYVTEGAFLAYGIDADAVFAEVQISNLKKAGGGKDANGKWMKPAGWTPPDIAKVLEHLSEVA